MKSYNINLDYAYIEVGKKCFTFNCVICNVKNQGYSQSSTVSILEAISKLTYLNCKKIRFTGRDPMSNKDIGSLAKFCKSAGIKTDITTTLAFEDESLIKDILNIDKIRISLSGVEDTYKKYFGVDKWSIVENNIYKLLENSENQEIIFYYAVFENNCDTDSLEKFMRFIYNLSIEYDSRISCEIFSEINTENNENYNFILSTKTIDMIKLYEESIQEFTETFTCTIQNSNNSKKRTECSVSRKAIYICDNGDIYPCCMAGGELGNTSLNELKLCNINDQMEIIYIALQTGLKNLNNRVCDNCTPKYLKLQKRIEDEH